MALIPTRDPILAYVWTAKGPITRPPAPPPCCKRANLASFQDGGDPRLSNPPLSILVQLLYSGKIKNGFSFTKPRRRYRVRRFMISSFILQSGLVRGSQLLFLPAAVNPSRPIGLSHPIASYTSLLQCSSMPALGRGASPHRVCGPEKSWSCSCRDGTRTSSS